MACTLIKTLEVVVQLRCEAVPQIHAHAQNAQNEWSEVWPVFGPRGKESAWALLQQLANANLREVEAEKPLPLRESIHQYDVHENPRNRLLWHCVDPDWHPVAPFRHLESLFWWI